MTVLMPAQHTNAHLFVETATSACTASIQALQPGVHYAEVEMRFHACSDITIVMQPLPVPSTPF
jgi:hypothetical protein